jgi:small subunit ribosomal protein S2
MHTLPSVIFVVDPTVERICVREANALNIPVVAIVDTNSDPSNIECVIPANDDAVRSVKLITSALADAVIEAKEGVSPKLAAEVEEEMVDIKTVLDKTVPNLELAESEDEPAKKRKKKPAKKPVAKAEKPAEAAEKPAENKEEK